MTISQAFDVALQHHRAGRLAEAENLYRQILAAQPSNADALHHLGLIAQQVGRHDLSVDWISQAVTLAPNNPSAHSNLGEAYRALGRLDEAMTAYRRALELKPDFAEAHNNLGAALVEKGSVLEAEAAYRAALVINPDFARAHHNLGVALAELGRFDEAAIEYRRALELEPDYPQALNNLGAALAGQGQPDEAIAMYRRALAVKPDYPQALNNLGVALATQGQLDDGIAAYRRALALNPENAWAHSNLIYTLHFLPEHGGRMANEERQRWNRQFGDPLKRSIQPHANDRNPNRRLRIGYVSADFRDHVIGRNLLPLFDGHDHQDFEIVCYSGVMLPDSVTERYRERADLWRSTIGVGDDALAAMIRTDGVDVLVDLTQHLEGNRLPVFARQPAPVQVSFAGYPESAGLDAIRRRISDRYLEGHSLNDALRTKEHVHVIDSFWCYDPCGIELEVNGLPASETGQVTFGNLGNFRKVNGRVLKAWARVLGRVADSRMLIWCPAGSARERTLGILEREGVASHRVEFVGQQPRPEYLALYHRVDIVLDTFPYGGHTTSLDALWMGVPLVSMAGQTPVSRAGLSQLSNLGLPELAADSEADFVRIAAELAGDFSRMADLRSTLRPRMKASVLMDAPRFALNIEAAYRAMWKRWGLAGD